MTRKPKPETERISGPSRAVIKRLFGLSSNRCAFPRCTAPLIEGETVVGHVCHIKAASPGGPRYDDKQTSSDRHGFANLLLLCPRHHTVVDDDIDAYTVERLHKMKAGHEAAATPLQDQEVERATNLILVQSVTSVNQSGGITAHTVNQTIHVHPQPLVLATDQRQSMLERARAFHHARVKAVVSKQAPVAMIEDGLFILHVYPLHDASQHFETISSQHRLFPPMRTPIIQDWEIRYDGGQSYLLTGSNAEGLKQEQRAYTCVFETACVEAVHSNLFVGQQHEFLELPYIEALLVRYAHDYCHALQECGVEPPYVVLASVADVKNKNLLRDFFRRVSLRDRPFGVMQQNEIALGEYVVASSPTNYNDCAKQLQSNIFRRLANVAGLPGSPSFDADGNYDSAESVGPP